MMRRSVLLPEDVLPPPSWSALMRPKTWFTVGAVIAVAIVVVLLVLYGGGSGSGGTGGY